ncbi:MAG: Spy/CpxP family protein refolding chaperone [Candidatus Margulisiibacteriota bacterium]
MMRKYVLVLIMGMLLLVGRAMADPQVGPPQSHSPEKMIEKMAKDLELTDQQKEKFVADANRVEEKAKSIREKNRQLFDKVQVEVSLDNPDMKKVASYIQEISKNDAQIHLMRIERIVELRKFLSPEQKKKLDAIMKQKKEEKRKH